MDAAAEASNEPATTWLRDLGLAAAAEIAASREEGGGKDGGRWGSAGRTLESASKESTSQKSAEWTLNLRVRLVHSLSS